MNEHENDKKKSLLGSNGGAAVAGALIALVGVSAPTAAARAADAAAPAPRAGATDTDEPLQILVVGHADSPEQDPTAYVPIAATDAAVADAMQALTDTAGQFQVQEAPVWTPPEPRWEVSPSLADWWHQLTTNTAGASPVSVTGNVASVSDPVGGSESTGGPSLSIGGNVWSSNAVYATYGNWQFLQGGLDLGGGLSSSDLLNGKGTVEFNLVRYDNGYSNDVHTVDLTTKATGSLGVNASGTATMFDGGLLNLKGSALAGLEGVLGARLSALGIGIQVEGGLSAGYGATGTAQVLQYDKDTGLFQLFNVGGGASVGAGGQLSVGVYVDPKQANQVWLQTTATMDGTDLTNTADGMQIFVDPTTGQLEIGELRADGNYYVNGVALEKVDTYPWQDDTFVYRDAYGQWHDIQVDRADLAVAGDYLSKAWSWMVGGPQVSATVTLDGAPVDLSTSYAQTLADQSDGWYSVLGTNPAWTSTPGSLLDGTSGWSGFDGSGASSGSLLDGADWSTADWSVVDLSGGSGGTSGSTGAVDLGTTDWSGLGDDGSSASSGFGADYYSGSYYGSSGSSSYLDSSPSYWGDSSSWSSGSSFGSPSYDSYYSTSDPYTSYYDSSSPYDSSSYGSSSSWDSSSYLGSSYSSTPYDYAMIDRPYVEGYEPMGPERVDETIYDFGTSSSFLDYGPSSYSVTDWGSTSSSSSSAFDSSDSFSSMSSSSYDYGGYSDYGSSSSYGSSSGSYSYSYGGGGDW